MLGNHTLRERIAEGLREAIVKGEVRPGTRLQEVEVAATYSASRTPVREAFRQLASEGFLQIRPRRGAVVAPITAKDVREFYELKSVLEGYAARLAVERISDSEIDQMQALNNELRECFAAGDVSKMVYVHNEFHNVFVRACGNERLVGLLEALVKQFQRFRIALSHTEAIGDSIQQHDEIISAFRARDIDQASYLVSENSARGSEALISNLLAA